MADKKKTVAILGAGVAGLASAKTLKQYGLYVTVFEAGSDLGGVWANNYRTLRVLEPASVYGLPDWPWPAGTPLFPSAAEVRAYLTSYAKHFGIFDRIRFKTRVVQTTPRETGGWVIEVDSTAGRESHEFDFFVIAPGMFNIPKIPSWPGTDCFAGDIIHTSEFCDPSVVIKKRVVVVGFSRSAMDVATDAADHAGTVTVVHRSVRWPVPEKILGLIRNHVLLFSRWPTLFAPPWIRPTRPARMLHGAGAPAVRLFWKFFEVLLSSQFRLRRRRLMPDRPIGPDLFTNLYIVPPRFFGMVDNGKIGLERSDIESFETSGVRLKNGKTIPADVVICGTGWKQEYPFLPPEMLRRVRDEDGMHLYRRMIHPALPNFAFVGGVQGLNSATCYAIQATWLARYLTGKFTLPTQDEQLAEIEALRTWSRIFITQRPNRSQILNLHQLPYIDELMTDMGLRKRRKNILIDQFVPYTSSDYQAATATVQPR